MTIPDQGQVGDSSNIITAPICIQLQTNGGRVVYANPIWVAEDVASTRFEESICSLLSFTLWVSGFIPKSKVI